MSAISQQWFQQWSPPPGIFNNPFLHQSLPQSPAILSQSNGYSQQYQQSPYPRAEPYRGYSANRGPSAYPSEATDLIPGRFIFQGPSGHGGPNQILPGSQNIVGDNELGLTNRDPFAGPNIRFFQSPEENFPYWHPQAQSIPRAQLANKEFRKPKVPGSSMLGLLPLLAAGLVSGQGQGIPVRGDQSPEGPDPDRDLGGAPPLRTLYHWSLMDFEYDSEGERRAAIDSKEFIPENSLPLGLEVWKERVFVTFPRWKPGVPCTLATAPRAPLPAVTQPPLKPYPDWSWHRQQGDCSGLTSVFRISADSCGRLWVLDSGQVEALSVPRQVCPPQVMAFDLATDRVIGRWPIPEEHVLQNSLFTNIVTDIRDGKCEDVHVYFTDVWRFGILVFRLRDEKFWKFTSHLFYPDPLASDFNLHGINFQWSDGVFGISLTPVNKYGDKTFYFHPMSSYREFQMPASILRNQTAVNDTSLLARSIHLAGESRGYSGHSSASAIDRNGVMFYNLVTRDSLGCWDTRKPYKRATQGVVARDEQKLVFPNDLKIDNEEKQSVWVLSNRLPMFLYRTLDPKDINFRIMREYVEEAVSGTVCDPRQPYAGPYEIEPECY